MKESIVSKATLGRLPIYLKFLQELPKEKYINISATIIARELGLGEVQVRKDLGSVVGTGKPKVGYVTTDLIDKLKSVLGYYDKKNAIIVGAGKLGKALLEYNGFGDYGLEILAAFDSDDKCIESTQNKKIYSVDYLKEFCESHEVKIGIITVPDRAAQEICDKLVACGINAIWNFAPINLIVPENVLLQQENLALSLAHLRIQMIDKENEN